MKFDDFLLRLKGRVQMDYNDPKFSALFEIMTEMTQGDTDAICVVIRKDGKWLGYASSTPENNSDLKKAALKLITGSIDTQKES